MMILFYRETLLIWNCVVGGNVSCLLSSCDCISIKRDTSLWCKTCICISAACCWFIKVGKWALEKEEERHHYTSKGTWSHGLFGESRMFDPPFTSISNTIGTFTRYIKVCHLFHLSEIEADAFSTNGYFVCLDGTQRAEPLQMSIVDDVGWEWAGISVPSVMAVKWSWYDCKTTSKQASIHSLGSTNATNSITVHLTVNFGTQFYCG